MQGPRNWRGRHRQYIDLLSHLLDALLVAYAESLLFVDDEQAEVGEFQILRQDAVGPDDDVNLSRPQSLQNFFLLLRITEAADHLDRYGKGPKRCLNVS